MKKTQENQNDRKEALQKEKKEIKIGALSIYWRTVIIATVIFLVINLMGFQQDFANYYSDSTFYNIVSDIYARCTSWLPFLLAELILVLSVIAILGYGIVVFVWLLGGKKCIKKFKTIYGKALLAHILVLLGLCSIKYTIPFRTNTLVVNKEANGHYTIEELIIIKNYMTEQANEIAKNIQRDKEGHVIVPDDYEADIQLAMRNLGGQYSRLKGYYARCKPSMFSAVIDLMGIGGVTYPFTGEVMYNKYMSKLYIPLCKSHELVHNKGYYKENEANFLSFVACSECQEEFVRYSAYVFGRWEIDKRIDEKLGEMEEADIKRYESMYVELSKQVIEDNIYFWEQTQEEYEAEVSESVEEFLSEPAEKIADVGWSTQRKILKEDNYDGVVKMLLEYYDGILY